jgi:peroxiredoxin
MKGFFPLSALMAVVLFGPIAKLTIQIPTNPSSSGYLIGEKAEDFQLKNYDGRTVSLSDYPDAKGFIIVFTSNHCPYAEAYENRLVGLYGRFAAMGFPLIAINPNAPEAAPGDNAVANARKAKEKGFPFPYLSDSLQTVFPKFGAVRTPHVFILNADRIVKYQGTIDDNAEIPSRVKKRYVEDAINLMLGGSDPITTTTKTVGCKIRQVPRDSTGKVIK